MDLVEKQKNKIKVMLVEDHHVLRGGLRMLINAQPDMMVISEAGDGAAALTILESGTDPDILLSDLNMPDMDGFVLFERIKELNLQVKPVAFSMTNSSKHVERAFDLGCLGYLTKSIESEELLFGIRQVACGKRYLCSEILDVIVPDSKNNSPSISSSGLPNFSSRELEVLERISQGMTNAQISDKLFLSKRTVEGHRQSLLDKTGSINTAVLVKYAVLNGLII
jgi:DNA-binding NarL/FixJ family response regulator